MFICNECGERSLSTEGKRWAKDFPGSFGPCEVCEAVRQCADIYSGWEWAWEFSAKEEDTDGHNNR